MIIRGILFDLGNTLVRYWLKMLWPGMLQAALAVPTAWLMEQRGLHFSVTELAERVQAENHEAPDYRVRPLAGRLARIYGLAEDAPELGGLCRLFCQPLLAEGEIYPDTIPTLTALHHQGYKLGLVSNMPWGCPSGPWREELQRLGLTEWLEAVVFCTDVGWRKPAPQPFLEAVQQLGLTANECLFVGDDPRWDLAGPQALEMPAVVLDREGALKLPDDVTVIHGLDELSGVLNRINGKIRKESN
ncbi:MAG: HAD family hydrolase [Anaerolineae bacterium]